MLVRLRTQRGVAMVTVLFVAAVLTVSASAAAFVTVREFQASNDDRRASRALAFAEAGVDRFMQEIRRGDYTYAQVVMQDGTEPYTPCVANGITYPIITLDGQFTPSGAFSSRIGWLEGDGAVDADGNGCPDAVPSPRKIQTMVIESTGTHPTALRVVEQIVDVGGITLPIGLHAGSVDANGNGTVQTVSMVTRGDLIGREKITFTGDDPFYTKGDFYSGLDPSVADDPMPAAAHAAGSIFFQQGGANTEIHPPSPNCDIDDNSVWDGSADGVDDDDATWNPGGACTGTLPPTSRFTESQADNLAPTPQLAPDDHIFFKEAAQTSGLYCSFDVDGNPTCTKAGAADPSMSPAVFQDADIEGLPRNFVAYMEFAEGTDPFDNPENTIKWDVDTGGCEDDPDELRSVVLIIKNGSLSMQSGSHLTGAIFVEDGRLDSEGNYTIEGTMIAQEMWIRGGATFTLSDCWVKNIPGPFINVTAQAWSESDR